MIAETRVGRLYAAGDLRVEKSPLRNLGPNDTLIRISSVGVCGSDIHYYTHGKNGQNSLTNPTVLGHEAAGTIVAVGEAVELHPGTPVAIEPALGCMECDVCRSGHYNVCPSGTCFGSPPTDGLLAELVVVDASHLHILPSTIDLQLAAAIEPLSVAVWAVERSQIQLGHRVLVTGAGPIGLLVAQVARRAGALDIVVADINVARLSKAVDFGATETIDSSKDSLDELDPFDRVIECTASPQVLARSIQAVVPNGRVTVVGQASPSVDGIPLATLQRYEIDLVAAFRYAHAFPKAIRLASDGTVNLSSLVTAQFGIDDSVNALTASSTDPSNLKVVINP